MFQQHENTYHTLNHKNEKKQLYSKQLKNKKFHNGKIRCKIGQINSLPREQQNFQFFCGLVQLK